MLSTSSQARAPGLPPRRFRTTIDVTLGKSSPEPDLEVGELADRPPLGIDDGPAQELGEIEEHLEVRFLHHDRRPPGSLRLFRAPFGL